MDVLLSSEEAILLFYIFHGEGQAAQVAQAGLKPEQAARVAAAFDAAKSAPAFQATLRAITSYPAQHELQKSILLGLVDAMTRPQAGTAAAAGDEQALTAATKQQVIMGVFPPQLQLSMLGLAYGLDRVLAASKEVLASLLPQAQAQAPTGIPPSTSSAEPATPNRPARGAQGSSKPPGRPRKPQNAPATHSAAHNDDDDDDDEAPAPARGASARGAKRHLIELPELPPDMLREILGAVVSQAVGALEARLAAATAADAAAIAAAAAAAAASAAPMQPPPRGSHGQGKKHRDPKVLAEADKIYKTMTALTEVSKDVRSYMLEDPEFVHNWQRLLTVYAKCEELHGREANKALQLAESPEHPEMTFQRALFLVTQTGCQICGAKAIRKVYWEMGGGVRCCRPCLEAHTMSDFRLRVSFLQEMGQCVSPHMLWEMPHTTAQMFNRQRREFYTLRFYWTESVFQAVHAQLVAGAGSSSEEDDWSDEEGCDTRQLRQVERRERQRMKAARQRHRQMAQAKEQAKKAKKGKDAGAAAKKAPSKATKAPSKAKKGKDKEPLVSEGDLSDYY